MITNLFPLQAALAHLESIIYDPFHPPSEEQAELTDAVKINGEVKPAEHSENEE